MKRRIVSCSMRNSCGSSQAPVGSLWWFIARSVSARSPLLATRGAGLRVELVAGVPALGCRRFRDHDAVDVLRRRAADVAPVQVALHVGEIALERLAETAAARRGGADRIARCERALLL